jgi:hypothetical protein
MQVKKFASGLKTGRPKILPSSEAGYALQERPQARLPGLQPVITPGTAAASTAHDQASTSHTGDKEGHNGKSLETQHALVLGAVEEAPGPVTGLNEHSTLEPSQHAVASSSGRKLVDTTGSDNSEAHLPDLIKPVEPTSDTGPSLDLKQAPDNRKVRDLDLTNTATSAEDAAMVNFKAAQRREWVKEHVWQILTHKLRGAERISGGIVVETESHNSQQMLIVRCYGPAVARAREIRKLLEKTNHKLVSQGFILSIREESRPGTDLRFLAEPGKSDVARPRQHSHDNVRSSSRPVSSHGVSASQVRDTHKVNDTTTTPMNGKNREESRFANTPYWNSLSVPVDCLLRVPRKSQHVTNTLCGALIRMTSWELPQEPQSRVWTCGGIVRINGVPYALTTAHPWVLQSTGKDQVDIEETNTSASEFVLPAYNEIDSKANDRIDGPQNWQTLGQVYKHALSNNNQIPTNYDWLLIDIAKGHVLPNILADSSQDGSLDPQSRNRKSMSIRTWRGSIQATVMPGFSFMILGESLFKARKFSVDQPMGESNATTTMHFPVELTMIRCTVQGDSGSWVFKGEDVLGVVIAGSSESGGGHYAYAISMTEVCRNISIGMGNALVHVPTAIENAITAHETVHPGRDTAELAVLLIKNLVQQVAQTGSDILVLSLLDGASSSSSVINSLLVLGRICPRTRSPDHGTRYKTVAQRRRIKVCSVPCGFCFEAASATSAVASAISNTVSNTVSNTFGLFVPRKTSLWLGLRRFDELQNLKGLFDIFAGVDPRLDVSQISQLVQRTMIELGISPIPSLRHLVVFLRNFYRYRRRMSVPSPTWVPDRHSIFSETLSQLPRILARMFYAASSHRFFVYCGPWGNRLHRMSQSFELGVVMIDAEFDVQSLNGRQASELQIFVIPEGQLINYEDDGARFGTYGDIVEHSRLRMLLLRLADHASCERILPARNYANVHGAPPPFGTLIPLIERAVSVDFPRD